MRKMPLIRRYREFDTNLEELYSGIENEIEREKELEIVKETSGKIKEILFKNITAVRSTLPKQVKDTLREVSVTLMGEPDDWLLELHVGSWFEGFSYEMEFMETANGSVPAVRGVSATEYMTQLRSTLDQLVKKSSQNYAEQKIETVKED